MADEDFNTTPLILIWDETREVYGNYEVAMWVSGNKIMANPIGREIVYSDDLGITWSTQSEFEAYREVWYDGDTMYENPNWRLSYIQYSEIDDAWYIQTEHPQVNGGSFEYNQTWKSLIYRSTDNGITWTWMQEKDPEEFNEYGGSRPVAMGFKTLNSILVDEHNRLVIAGHDLAWGLSSTTGIARWDTPASSIGPQDSFLTTHAIGWSITNLRALGGGYVFIASPSSAGSNVDTDLHFVDYDMTTFSILDDVIIGGSSTRGIPPPIIREYPWPLEDDGVILSFNNSTGNVTTWDIVTRGATAPLDQVSITWPADVNMARLNVWQNPVGENRVLALGVPAGGNTTTVYAVYASSTDFDNDIISTHTLEFPSTVDENQLMHLYGVSDTQWVISYMTNGGYTQIARFQTDADLAGCSPDCDELTWEYPNCEDELTWGDVCIGDAILASEIPCIPVTITTQPTPPGTTPSHGVQTSLHVVVNVDASADVIYQWYRNGLAIDGAIEADYVFIADWVE